MMKTRRLLLVFWSLFTAYHLTISDLFYDDPNQLDIRIVTGLFVASGFLGMANKVIYLSRNEEEDF